MSGIRSGLAALVGVFLCSTSLPAQQQIQLPLALDGACPVAALEIARENPDAAPEEVFATAGAVEFTVVYDNLVFRFANWDNMQKFLANPARYTPALGGFCVTCLKESNTWVLSKRNLFVFHDGRFYLFPNADKQKLFESDPDVWTGVDLANNGRCRVTEMDDGQSVAGDPAVSEVFGKRVYRFRDEAAREAFRRDPSRYRIRESSGNLP